MITRTRKTQNQCLQFCILDGAPVAWLEAEAGKKRLSSGSEELQLTAGWVLGRANGLLCFERLLLAFWRCSLVFCGCKHVDEQRRCSTSWCIRYCRCVACHGTGTEYGLLSHERSTIGISPLRHSYVDQPHGLPSSTGILRVHKAHLLLKWSRLPWLQYGGKLCFLVRDRSRRDKWPSLAHAHRLGVYALPSAVFPIQQQLLEPCEVSRILHGRPKVEW